MNGLGVEIGSSPMLFSEKSCKSLQSYVKFPLCACVDFLHFVPDVSDSVLVWFCRKFTCIPSLMRLT